jgi:hypothetical protein
MKTVLAGLIAAVFAVSAYASDAKKDDKKPLEVKKPAAVEANKPTEPPKADPKKAEPAKKAEAPKADAKKDDKKPAEPAKK